MAVVKKQDNRLPISWRKKLSVKDLGDIWCTAYRALESAGRTAELRRMQEQIRKSGSQQRTLKIILKYVVIE